MESFIHIGMPKSASTYLQNNYFNQLDGIEYIQKNNSQFIKEKIKLLQDNFTKDFREEFQQYCKTNKIKKIIYSQETISKLYTNKGLDVIYHYQLLKKIFKNIKIIYIIRRQDSYLLSAYKNSIMNGNNLSLDKFLNYNNIYDKTFHNKMLYLNWKSVNLFNKVTELYETFGKENVLVLPMELLKEDKELFFNHLDCFIGTEYRFNVKTESKNVSFSDCQIKILSVLNKLSNNGVNPFYIIINNPFRTFFNIEVKFDKYLHINNIIKLFKFKFIEYRLMDNDMKQEILEYYNDDNQKLSNLIKLDLSRFGYHS